MSDFERFVDQRVAPKDPLAIEPVLVDGGVRVNPEVLAAAERLGIYKTLLPVVTMAALAGVGLVAYRLASGIPPEVVDAVTNGGRVELVGPYLAPTYWGVAGSARLNVQNERGEEVLSLGATGSASLAPGYSGVVVNAERPEENVEARVRVGGAGGEGGEPPVSAEIREIEQLPEVLDRNPDN